MIILKSKCFSAKDMVSKLVARLEHDGIEDFDVSDKIPKDSISVNADLNNLLVYIPFDLEYSQYGIDDFIRSMVPYLRTSTTLDRDIYKMKLSGKLTEAQYVKLIKYIIEEEEYCVIINDERK